jgi:peptidoglycan/LPS O-acetylase OafA/YrhL
MAALTKSQLPNLYVLRFVLSAFVILYHLPLICKSLGIPYYNELPLFHKGELSVYYFFTLSGFLIIRLIYLEIQATSGFDMKAFYLKRIARLYPVYYLVFFTGILLYHYILPLLNIPYVADYKLSELIISYVFFIPNVFMMKHPEVGSILIILWSIGVEEQFYLMIPVILLLFRKKIVAVLGTLLFLSLLLLLLYPALYKYNNFYFYFIAGGIMAVISTRGSSRIFSGKVIHTLVYTAFAVSFFTDYFNFNHAFLTHGCNLIISASLINLIANYPKFTLNNAFFNYLGKISYGIYMYHMIIITGILFLVQRTGIHDKIAAPLFILLLNITVLGLTVLIAHLSFKYYEKLFYKPRS